MAAPAVAVHFFLGRYIGIPGWPGKVSAFCGGAGAIALSALLMASALVFSDEKFLMVAGGALLIHLPIMAIEGLVTVFCIGFLIKVKPELLQHRRHGGRSETG
jgi:cobalt/nickel transport system permease protein